MSFTSDISGNVEEVSEKKSILRSTSEIGTPSRWASSTILPARKSRASRELPHRFMFPRSEAVSHVGGHVIEVFGRGSILEELAGKNMGINSSDVHVNVEAVDH